MPRIARSLTLIICLTLSACATSAGGAPASTSVPPTATAAPPTATPAPTAIPPTPTPVPKIKKGVIVAGVAVGGKTPDEARALIEAGLASAIQPLDVRAADAQALLRPEDIGLRLATDEMVAAAVAAPASKRIPLQVSVDRTLLEGRLTELAAKVNVTGTLTLISDTKTISRSFAMAGGRYLDVAASADLITQRLGSPGAPRRITLPVAAARPGEGRPTPAQLQQQVEAMAATWKGVVGVYVYDLKSGSVIAQLNQDTVFSGASVMKVPIMLNAYLNLKSFTPIQQTWLRKMIVESDNYSANSLLAASAGGGGTDDALVGALAMSKMLHDDLGLQHTYQNMPYESSEYLVKIRGVKIKRGPPQEGPPPYTDPDPVLRTTPAEMASIFLMLEQCRTGSGPLLEKFSQLTPERCAEMVTRLEGNGDRIRMRSGLPKDAVVAHKSGWIEDMQSDVGIVRSPGGDFLVAIYVYKDIRKDKIYLTDDVAAPVIGHFARLVYSYYNPAAAPAK